MRRRQQREETRQRVYEAALQVFREDGVVAARIEDITDRAGVSRGSFYFHFPTKDQVLLERSRVSEMRIAAVLQALPESTPLDEVLAAFGREFTREWQMDPRIFPEAGMVTLRHTSVAMAEGRIDPVRAALAAHFRRAGERGAISSAVPPDLLSDFFLVNSFGAALAWSGSPERLGLEAVLQSVAYLFLNGVRPQSPVSKTRREAGSLARTPPARTRPAR
jgi:AcrR family transcriptional regulator